MTTIAYRDGELAADTLACRDGSVTGHTIKVHRLRDGRLVGLLGRAGGAYKLLEWMKQGEPQPQPDCDDCAIVVIRGDGSCLTYEDGFCEPSSAAPFKAWGSGGDIALGAMAAGATAEEAVRIATQWDLHTGGDVTVLRV